MRHATTCRICAAGCGLVVDVEGGRAVGISGDPLHAVSRGFTCVKGRRLGALHEAPDRFVTSQRRVDGALVAADSEAALAEVAQRLSSVIAEHGPDAVGVYVGTNGYRSGPYVAGLMTALGLRKLFTSMTIDQSAKFVAFGRVGRWLGGRQRMDTSDVWLLAGSNPFVSMQGGDLTGFEAIDGVRRIRELRAEGMQLIVIDPRRTETASAADLHLAPRPGTDAVIFAALLQVVLAEDLHDQHFCDGHVADLDRLRAALRGASPAAVATLCGLRPEEIVDAARRFGRGPRGMASTGTGPDMAPWSNLTAHLVWCLNLVCGRVARPGDTSTLWPALQPMPDLTASVHPPDRPWDRGFRSRTGYGTMTLGYIPGMAELPTGCLVDEILAPGQDRLRALLVVGGNPVMALPNPGRAAAAFRGLDLLATIDAFPSETAALSHLVLAPAMQFERADHTAGLERMYRRPFAQYSPALLEAPSGVRDDGYYLMRIAQLLGVSASIFGHTVQPGEKLPDADELLEWSAGHGRVSLDTVKSFPHGHLFSELEAPVVREVADDGARFELLADDVADELRRALSGERIAIVPHRPFRLVVRRMKGTMNTLGRHVEGFAKGSPNRCYMNPEDLGALSLEAGALVELESARGCVTAVVEPDATLRRSVVAMSHGWGSVLDGDEDPRLVGTSSAQLVSDTFDLEPINAMPQFSAIDLAIRPAPPPAARRHELAACSVSAGSGGLAS